MIKKLMTAAALLAMAGAASAATLYTTGVLDFNKTTKGSYLGKIGAAVPVTVLKKQGNLSYVRISGWTLAEYPSMIFAEPGVRIEYGSFDEESAVKTNPKAGEKVVEFRRVLFRSGHCRRLGAERQTHEQPQQALAAR